MRDFRKQRSASHGTMSFVLLLIGVLFLALVAALAARATWQMYVKFAVASENNAAAQKDLADLKLQYAQVSATVKNIETPRGEEGEIRERFGVGLPGEGAIQIVRDTTSTDLGEAPEENIFMKILHALIVW